MRSAVLLVAIAAVGAACAGPSAAPDSGSDGARADAPRDDSGNADAALPVDAGGPLVSGFVFEGPRAPSAPPNGSDYTLDLPTGAGTPGATVGSPCTSGNDCTALGAHAACFRNASGGFCAIDCDTDPEGPSVLCPSGSLCFTSLRADNGRLCLPTCTTQSDCAGGVAGAQCSASLFTFNVASGHARVCLPSCASDADCNVDTSGLVCDTTLHRCESPREVIGSTCTSNDDCRGLGASGVCLHSTRDASRSYCTSACDPSAPDACVLGGTNSSAVGPCVSGYAATSDGVSVPVCLGACSSDAECQLASTNTCSYVPTLASSVCAIACSSDADCVDGACDVASGDCRRSAFFDPNCSSDSSCALGLCVSDFHHGGQHNCSKRCASDADCPSESVCVTSPVALDGAGEHLVDGVSTSVGFCAPSCTLDAGMCADPTTTCLLSHDPPEIDFAGSGSASHSFCWR